MDEILGRRRRLFSGAAFSSALFCNGDKSKGESASFCYFSGCDVGGSYLVLKKNGGMLLTHEMNFAEAKESCRYPVQKFGKEPAKGLRKACGRGHVAFSPSEMSAARYLALRKMAKLKLVQAGGKISQMRGSKSASEVAAITKAARATRKILDTLKPWGFGTEAKLAAHLKICALKAGGEIAFEPIVATGKNSRLPHHKCMDRKLGNFVLVDFGVKIGGYCADMTRCYFRGKCKEEREAYAKCRRVYGEIMEALPKCKTGKDIALLGEKLMKKHGLPPLIHSIGHGIGMEVHEYPHLGLKSNDMLSRAVLAIEPAAYFARFGVRYEGMAFEKNGEWKKL